MRMYFLTILLIAMGHVLQAQKTHLQKGDILFQDLDCELCDAIEKVTEGYGGMDFSHCAMVVSVGDTVKVIEAIGGGVQLTALEKFLDREKGGVYIMGRLKGRRDIVEGAVDFALQQLGEPYDEEFLPDNGQWYCSELIYASFRHANEGKDVFSLEPMTFKDPQTGEFVKTWQEYYEKLEKDIPEGVPGINPGGISRSPELSIIPVKR